MHVQKKVKCVSKESNMRVQEVGRWMFGVKKLRFWWKHFPSIIVMSVFIGGVTPPMYNYYFTPLQRSYTRNIPGRTRDFHITAWVRYSSEGPTTPGGPLRPDWRRPWGPLITRHDACVARSSHVFFFRPEDPRRRAISALALGIGFIVPDVLSSRTFGNRPKVVSPTTSLISELQ